MWFRGKTALAIRAARTLAGQFPDRQMFVDLQGHTPGQEPVRAEDALAGLLAAVGGTLLCCCARGDAPGARPG